MFVSIGLKGHESQVWGLRALGSEGCGLCKRNRGTAKQAPSGFCTWYLRLTGFRGCGMYMSWKYTVLTNSIR